MNSAGMLEQGINLAHPGEGDLKALKALVLAAQATAPLDLQKNGEGRPAWLRQKRRC
jgi:hypothetical protein